MTSLRWLFSMLVAGVLLVPFVGCESLTDDDDDNDDDRVVREDERISRDPDDDDLDRLPREIPSSAVRVERGKGQRLVYTPSDDGTVYVYNADTSKLIYSGRLNDGERFVLDPTENEATIDGRRVLGADLKKNQRYYLYFDER